MELHMRIGVCLVLGASLYGLGGCATGGGDGGGGGEGPAPEAEAQVEANFDQAAGGNFMVGQDDSGNQYTARQRDGAVTEGNVRFPDGTVVKASLDDQGRPVKFRSSTGENADIVYGEEGARIRYLAAGDDPQDPNAYQDVAGVDTTSAKSRVQARRILYEEKRRRAMQDIPTQGAEDTDTAGLGTDGIGEPEILIIIFTIPASVFCRQMINIVEVVLFEYPLQLPMFADIATDVIRSLRLHQVTDPDFMTSASEFEDEIRADKTYPTGNQYSSHVHLYKL